MSGHTFDVYQEGADLGEALRRAVANARRRRQGHGPGTSGIAQKNSAVPVQDDPVTHIRAISIARDPVCDEDGEHVIGWVFAGLYHV
jgi:hypothetical protein